MSELQGPKERCLFEGQIQNESPMSGSFAAILASVLGFGILSVVAIVSMFCR